MERSILIAVAWADIIACRVIYVLCVAAVVFIAWIIKRQGGRKHVG